MSIQDDQTARVMAPETVVNAAEATVMADDMRAILKLIATQLEDSDRRQSEVLGDMHRRLAEMGNDARLTRAQVPAAFAPGFERIEEGIEQLALLVAAAEQQQPASAFADPLSSGAAEASEFSEAADAGAGTAADVEAEDDAAWNDVAEQFDANEHEPLSASGLEDFDDASEDRAADAVAPFAPISSVFPDDKAAFASEVRHDHHEYLEDAESDAGAEDLMITDNAADRLDLFDDAETGEPEHESADVLETGDATQPDQEASDASAAIRNPPDEQGEISAQDEAWDDSDAPWDREQAEALTRVYEAHQAEDALQSRPFAPQGISQVARFSAARTLDDDLDTDRDNDVPEAAPATQKQDMQVPAPAIHSHSGDHSCIANVAPIIEQAWLEERFAEIAAKIEESIFELRDDQALLSLSDRFGEFEERVGLALEDVATRHDVDALKSAEVQIDAMVGYFERIESQLGRIDSLEGQMETLLGRLSDDNLMQFFSGQGGSADLDHSGVAEAAAESVAQRFLAEFANGAIGGQGDNEAVGDMREALEAFITERRERDDEAAGMLDTIQQALIRVLDRIELLEAGYENPPMTSPLDDDFAEAGDFANEGGSEPGFEAPRSQRHIERPQSDYSQTRLEYPAAVMGNRPAEAKTRVEPQFETEPEMAGFEQQEAAFDETHDAAAEAADIEKSQADADYEAAEHSDEPASDAGLESQTGPHPEAQPEWRPEDRGQNAVSPIDRLRQEFIADARRARERAAEQALLAEASGETEPAAAKSRLSVPGLSSLSAKVRGAAAAKSQAPEKTAAKAPAATKPAGRAKVLAGEAAAPSSSRFAMPRSKLLVGAVIVLFATAGALLMMRSPSQPIADAAPPVIEQSFDKGTSGPQLTGPQETAPAMKGERAPDRRGSLEGNRVYDGEFNYDVPAGDEVQPLASGLAGVAVADLDKAPNPAALAKIRHQQRLAKMSSDLGAAAAYATPANLVAEQPSAQPSVTEPGSVTRASDGNHLDLPPATVGPLSLRLAAAKGDPSAQFEVAARLAGDSGTQQDLKGAVHWYQLAAAQGFAQAQYRLGTLYERGLGVDKDLARSGVWYERAAAQGNVKAMHNLAVVSAGREVGGPDYASAAKWFEAAAQYGLSDSQFNMAVLCENGLGVEKDLKRAYVYYSLASTMGVEQAKTRRDAVRGMLSKNDVEAAETQLQAFRPKMADRIVNDARVAGEDWKKRADGGY